MRLLASFIGTILAANLPAVAAEDRPPNVVLIISDDHAWNDYSFMGSKDVRTPRIDRLAAESATFRRGYVPTSLCSPSLASLITGLYPHQHRVTGNDPPATAGRHGQLGKDPALAEGRRRMEGLFASNPTLPRMLADRGYASFQAGKWWGGDFRNGGFTEGMTHGDTGRGGRHGDEGLNIGRKTMAPVTDFIDRSVGAGKPFFVWYAPMMPHQPHNPPERLLARYRDVAPNPYVAKYWAMIEWFDETCGALLDHLDERKVADNTIVVYLADNGWIQDPAAPRFAPGSKQSPRDGGLRTPILVRWPGKIRPATVDQPVSSIDVAPTILKAAGLAPTPAMPGVDLRDAEAVANRPAVFGAIFSHDAIDLDRPAASLRYRWVVSGGWKLIQPGTLEPKAAVELFHVSDDPFEVRDFGGRQLPKIDELRGMLDAWWKPEG